MVCEGGRHGFLSISGTAPCAVEEQASGPVGGAGVVTRHRGVRLAAAGIVVVGVVVVAVLVVRSRFGPVPAYVAIAAAPDPPVTGLIAFPVGPRRSDAGPPVSCVRVQAAAGGAERELTCESNLMTLLWRDQGTLVVVSWRLDTDHGVASYPVTEYDPVTGDVVSRWAERNPNASSVTPQRGRRRSDGMSVSIFDGRRVVLRSERGATQLVLDLDDEGAPRSYRIEAIDFSPDGRWLIAGDSAGRIIVIDPAGAIRPRVLADGWDRTNSAPVWWQESG